MALESSQGELQVWFRPHLDRKLGREIMIAQSLGSPNREFRDSTLGVSGKKCHSNVASAGERKEYYMGEGDGFPRV
jgi:hypothetical protein